MTTEELISRIWAAIEVNEYSAEPYLDMLSCVRNYEEVNSKRSHAVGRQIRDALNRRIRKGVNSTELMDVYKKFLLFDARADFDAYMQYLEFDRQAHERFYLPRRGVMLPVVEKLQMLEDGELDELFLSMPPRVGKTTLMLFFMTWVCGRHPEYPNLYCSYSDLITSAFYNGLLEIIKDPITYHWAEVFPEAKLMRTNAADEIFDLKRNKHYPTMTCRSLYGTLNGACDAERGYIVSDDLIGGIEEALNPDRLYSAWTKVDNNLIPRGKGGTRYLWIGTRWSVADPAGRRMDLLLNNPKFENRRFEIINLPALNADDESNFDYQYEVGFDTDYYQMRWASFEANNAIESWLAQYMGEPVERGGVLFSPDSLRFFNGLPDFPDRVFMAVDPAFGGGDYVAAPICYQYGDDIYVADVVYNNGDKKITQPLIIEAIKKHDVQAVQFEATKSTKAYAQEIDEKLRADGIRINLTTRPAPNTTSKEARIFDKAPEIRERMVFREKRDKTYDKFMQNVYSFKVVGKNKHDDAPDSLVQAMDMVTRRGSSVQIMQRIF